ncbi:hypothetical protein REPUB_Repub07fG0054900 [Reevesia pubescens]
MEQEERGTIRSQQEDDHLERSTKKIKATTFGVNDIHREEGKSFKDKLLESRLFQDCFNGTGMVEEAELDSDEEEDVDLDEDIPRVKIALDLKKSLRNPWRNALIIKLLGKTVSFNVLLNRITLMWKLSGDFDIVDLGHGYYVVKFENMEDRLKVLTGGP